MARPDLFDPEASAGQEAQRRSGALGWRAGGVAVVVASAAVLVAARAITGRTDSPAVWVAIAGLAVGWVLVGIGIWRRRYPPKDHAGSA